MKASKSIPCILLVLLLSCNKKIDHSNPAQHTVPTSCELCDYADQISGQYRGYAVSYVYQYQDSLTVSMEHIFLNLSPQQDSTIMYFRRIKDFDTLGTRIDTVSLQTSSGDFNPVGMKIFNDSMILKEKYYTAKDVITVLDFKGKKIP